MKTPSIPPPASKRWYVAFEVLHFRPKDQTEAVGSAWRNLILIEADSAVNALEHANELGMANNSDVYIENEAGRAPARCTFAGLHELLIIEDGIRDGTIIGRAEVAPPAEIQEFRILERDAVLNEYVGVLPSWFITERLMSLGDSADEKWPQTELVLTFARDPAEAFDKGLSGVFDGAHMGSALGLLDFARVYDDIVDGGELLWREYELGRGEVEIKAADELSAIKQERKTGGENR